MNKRENDLVILLTGTITPNSLGNLTIKDPEIRRQHYCEAINFYLNKTKYKIVFVENSGDKLERFPLVSDRIEYLTFNSAPIKPDRGIGYKELEIMDLAFKNSTFLKEASSVVKITGRLKVLNLSRLATKFINLRKSKCNLIYAHTFARKNMDSRCFFFTKDFWPYLKNMGKDLNQRYTFELSLWDATCEYQKYPEKNYIPLHTPLRIQGISGSFGVEYRHSFLFHYARLIRNLIYRIFSNATIVK